VLCLYILFSQVRKLKAHGFLLQACLLLIGSFAVNITVQGLYLWIYSNYDEDSDSTLSWTTFHRMMRSAEILDYCVFITLTVVIQSLFAIKFWILSCQLTQVDFNYKTAYYLMAFQIVVMSAVSITSIILGWNVGCEHLPGVIDQI